MHPDPPPRRLHLWTGVIVLGVFLFGAATGAGVMSWVRPWRRPPPPHGPEFSGGLPPPFRDMNLTSEQQEKVKPILEQFRAEVDASLKDVQPRIRAAEEVTDKALRATFTEEQNQQFDQWRAHRKPLFPRMPPPPLHGP